MTEDVKKSYASFLGMWHDIAALYSAGGYLSWDQLVMMPSEGIQTRAEQLTVIEKVMHERLVADGLWQTLEELVQAAREGMLSDAESANVRLAYRDVERARKIPTQLAEDMTRQSSNAVDVWDKAKKTNDFAMFLPHLKQTFALKREYAKLLAKDRYDLYTPLLEGFEPDFTTGEVKELFAGLEKELIPLVSKILSLPKPDCSLLFRSYGKAGLESLAKDIAVSMGLQLGKNSRLDESAHPFCSGSLGDVRITNRYSDAMESFFSAMHEAGHAIYELGLQQDHAFQPVGNAVSLGVHESQSRFWEVVVGKGRPHLARMFPEFKKRFPENLKSETADTFFKAINAAQASPIRVNADPLTYNLHVLLRFGIEQAIINGELEVDAGLPQEWNRRTNDLLGFTPKDDAEGIMQDTHWASGLVGYFPTYTIGNMISAQLHETLKSALPNFDDLVAAGNFSPIREWLGENIHTHGSLYDAKTLVRNATGVPIGHAALIRFFKERYGDVYGVTL